MLRLYVYVRESRRYAYTELCSYIQLHKRTYETFSCAILGHCSNTFFIHLLPRNNSGSVSSPTTPNVGIYQCTALVAEE